MGPWVQRCEAMIQKIQNADRLKAIKRSVEKEKQLHEGGHTVRITVHMGTCGIASGAQKVLDVLLDEMSKCGRSDISVTRSGCIGLCSQEPLMTVEVLGKEPVIYRRVDPRKVRKIFRGHILNGQVQDHLALARGRAANEEGISASPDSEDGIPHVSQLPFFALQKSLVLRNKGLIDPERIEDYIWRDGYQAMAKAFLEMTPSEIISEVKASGLRDRGRKGFPTGIKWEFCASSKGNLKYVLCHADEGDPGASMDRSLLEADPHGVLEGLIIAAKAIHSHQGYIYCRAEHELALKRLNLAIQQAYEYGLLGKNILGSEFDFDLEVCLGPDTSICGRLHPPFPTPSGLWEKPLVDGNVETYANIPQIILQGGEKYAGTGTESSKGTKVFPLAGKVNSIGLVEVPMGTTLGQIIFEIGGGIPSGKRFKAVQFGGPFGACIPGEYLNTPTDYEAITKAGAAMGSGGMTVMDEDTCMVDIARSFIHFCQDESCEKWAFCREGTERMGEILRRICEGEGRQGDIELLEDLVQQVKDTASCDLGQTAPNSILSTIRYFREEYEAHIDDKCCPAAVCSALFKSPCQHTCPAGMDIPAYIAFIRAGRIADAYKVLKQANPFPGVCGWVCGHPCQEKCRRAQLDEPVAIVALERFVTEHAKRPKVVPLPTTRKERIAIIGAGPSGLTAALELKKRGYAVTVFEELPEAGGMLRWRIPADRLPREELDREIQEILDTGVELQTRLRVGRDITFEELDKDFQMICLAVGAQKSVPLNIPGQDAEGVFGAVEFLRDYHLKKEVKVGKHVAVIGGGILAIDAARTAIRLGAKKVTIYYQREREDMPAQEWEIRAAEQEGVEIMYLVTPVRIITQYGKATKLELTQMRLDKFDRSGRRQPKPILGAEFKEKAEMVISAIGQKADLGFLPKESGIEIDQTFIEVDKDFRTQNAKVWAGGEAVTGPTMVIDAIKAGQRAARAIDEAIRLANGLANGQRPWVPPKEERIAIPFEVDGETTKQPQTRAREISPKLRRNDLREAGRGYTMETALAEASRCMRCDLGQVGKNRRKHANQR